ncbi:hypothetical protein [Yersinia bercovieri]
MIIVVWIGLNMIGMVKHDVYPFILLNLAFISYHSALPQNKSGRRCD